MAVKAKITLEDLEREEQELQNKEVVKEKATKKLPKQIRGRYEELEAKLAALHDGHRVQFICNESFSVSAYTRAEFEKLKVKISEHRIPFHLQIWEGCYFLVENYQEGIPGYDPGQETLKANTPVMKGGKLIYNQVGEL